MNFNFFYSFALDVNMIMFTFKQVGKKKPLHFFSHSCAMSCTFMKKSFLNAIDFGSSSSG